MDKRLLAIFAALGGTTIYALNHTIAKDVMPTYYRGLALLWSLIGGTVLADSEPVLPKQPIARADIRHLVRAAFLGMGITTLAFLRTRIFTPINSTVIITTTPIMVFLFLPYCSKSKWHDIVYWRSPWVFGRIVPYLFNNMPPNAPTSPGNFLFVVNASTYGLYMIYVKPLVKNIMQLICSKCSFWLGWWWALLGITWVFEVTGNDPSANLVAYWICGSRYTFTNYCLLYAIRHLRATTLSVFTYIQPTWGLCLPLQLVPTRWAQSNGSL